ncbi:unnamed protein product [Closterium sp. Naga37s-1]|nr:unnamed protein product [Closterium sp. Naga37s-1]
MLVQKSILTHPPLPSPLPPPPFRPSIGPGRWRFYPCAPKEPKHPSGWVAQLVRNGIEEIKVIGDPHPHERAFKVLQPQPPTKVALFPVCTQGAEVSIRVRFLLLPLHTRLDAYFHPSVLLPGHTSPFHQATQGVCELTQRSQRTRGFADERMVRSHEDMNFTLTDECLHVEPLSPLFPPLPSNCPPSSLVDERMVRSHEDMNFTLTDECLHVEPLSPLFPPLPSNCPPSSLVDERMVRSNEDMNLTLTDERFADERMVRSHEDMNFTLTDECLHVLRTSAWFCRRAHGFADERMVRSHEDMNFTLKDERSGKQLRVNFYWVDGIYRNREYGCSLRGQYTHNYHTFPNISTTANVTIIEGGYWAGKWCAEPLQALRARLPEFFIWALLAARANRARVVFRTPPPVPNAGSHCSEYAVKRGFAGPATNLYLAAANRHARQLAASVTRGAEMAVFDSWAVEVPRYGDTCPGDHHYSCFLGGQKRTKPVVRGGVGDAVARTFLHFLLHSLPMESSSTAEEQNKS